MYVSCTPPGEVRRSRRPRPKVNEELPKHNGVQPRATRASLSSTSETFSVHQRCHRVPLGDQVQGNRRETGSPHRQRTGHEADAKSAMSVAEPSKAEYVLWSFSGVVISVSSTVGLPNSNTVALSVRMTMYCPSANRGWSHHHPWPLTPSK